MDKTFAQSELTTGHIRALLRGICLGISQKKIAQQVKIIYELKSLSSQKVFHKS